MQCIKKERFGDQILTGLLGKGGDWFFGYSKTVPTPSHIKALNADVSTVTNESLSTEIDKEPDICTKCKAMNVSKVDMCKVCGLKSLLNFMT